MSFLLLFVEYVDNLLHIKPYKWISVVLLWQIELVIQIRYYYRLMMGLSAASGSSVALTDYVYFHILLMVEIFQTNLANSACVCF